MVKKLSDICLTCIQLSLDKVPNIGNNLPTVFKELLVERLSGHDNFSLDYIPHISRQLFLKPLTRLNFYKCDQINDNVLQLVEKCGCKLQTLTIYFCNGITDIGFRSITTSQDELTYLKLKKLKHLTDQGLQKVRSQKLKVVDLSNCCKVSFEGASSLVARNTSIEELYLSGIDEVLGENATSSKSQERFLKKHIEVVKIAVYLGHNLRELDTQLNQINDDCLIALAKHCPNLKKLNLHGSSRISGEALTKFFMGCTQLESLDLSYCTSLCQSPGCEALWTLPTSLCNLSLCGVLLTDQTILVECFQRLKNLKYARLCGVVALNDTTLDQILQHIGHSLVSLDLSGSINKVTDEGLKAIPEHCHRLEELAMNLLSGINGLELLPLFKDKKKASKFRKLYLSVKGLDESIIQEVVVSCCNLEKLDVGGLHYVNDDMLMALAENCTKLTDLSIKGCRQVTDAGICEIARCLPLTSLVLAGVGGLTDKSIFALANTCHDLTEIYLNGCAQISPTAVRYLIDCNIPRLFVKHATPNAKPNQLMAHNLDTGEFCRADLLEVS